MEKFLKGLALEIAARYFLEPDVDLSKLIAEKANEHGLTDEAIKRLVEFTNRAVFLELFAKSPDKTVEFPIAKFEKVREYLTGKEEPQMQAPEVEEEDMYDIDELLKPRYRAEDFARQILEDADIKKFLEDMKAQLQDLVRRKGLKLGRVTITFVKNAAQRLSETNAQLKENERKIKQLLRRLKQLGVDERGLNELLKQKRIPKQVRDYILGLYKTAQVKTASFKPSVSPHEFIAQLRRLPRQPQAYFKLQKLAQYVDPLETYTLVQHVVTEPVQLRAAQRVLYDAYTQRRLQKEAALNENAPELLKLLKERSELLNMRSEIASELYKIAQNVDIFPGNLQVAIKVEIENALKGVS